MARAACVLFCAVLVIVTKSFAAWADCTLTVNISGWLQDSITHTPLPNSEVCLDFTCVVTDDAGAFTLQYRTTVEEGQSFPASFCIDINSPGYPPAQRCMVRTQSPWPPCAGSDLTLTFNLSVILLDSVSTAVSDSRVLPDGYALWPNSPNPFNPSTEISFSLARASDVKLEIFDVLGRRVATPVARQLDVGAHSVEWNARDMPSGVYFYRLTAGGFSSVRKMLFLK